MLGRQLHLDHRAGGPFRHREGPRVGAAALDRRLPRRHDPHLLRGHQHRRVARHQRRDGEARNRAARVDRDEGQGGHGGGEAERQRVARHRLHHRLPHARGQVVGRHRDDAARAARPSDVDVVQGAGGPAGWLVQRERRACARVGQGEPHRQARHSRRHVHVIAPRVAGGELARRRLRRRPAHRVRHDDLVEQPEGRARGRVGVGHGVHHPHVPAGLRELRRVVAHLDRRGAVGTEGHGRVLGLEPHPAGIEPEGRGRPGAGAVAVTKPRHGEPLHRVGRREEAVAPVGGAGAVHRAHDRDSRAAAGQKPNVVAARLDRPGTHVVPACRVPRPQPLVGGLDLRHPVALVGLALAAQVASRRAQRRRDLRGRHLATLGAHRREEQRHQAGRVRRGHRRAAFDLLTGVPRRHGGVRDARRHDVRLVRFAAA